MKVGFSILEIVLVTSLLAVLAVFTVPVGIRFYQTSVLGDVAETAITLLRRAQRQAIAEKNNSAFGVQFFAGNMVLFQGTTYATRVVGQDEVFNFSNTVSVSGLSEVDFAAIVGTTANIGSVIFSSGGQSKTITVNGKGLSY